MIRTRARMGDTASLLCADPYGPLSQFNPACWMQWSADNSASATQAACQKAAGGSTGELYQRCLDQTRSNTAALTQTDPSGSADYSGITGSDPLGYAAGLANPDGALIGNNTITMLAIGAAVFALLAAINGVRR